MAKKKFPGKEESEQGQPQQKEKPKSREQIIRFAETNLDGRKKVIDALRLVSGVSFMYANAIATVSGFGDRRIGDLSEQELKGLEDMLSNPQKAGIPSWIYNRKYDPASSEDIHMIGSTLELRGKLDINEMKKWKTYKGVRHSAGLPVRGQRTRGSFRKGKVVGVQKKKKG